MPDRSPAPSGVSRRLAAPVRRRDAAPRLRSEVVVGVALLTVASAAACGEADAGEKAQPPTRGGGLRGVLSAAPTRLDPQRVAVVAETNPSQLTTRPHAPFQSAPGKAGSDSIGDLATHTG